MKIQCDVCSKDEASVFCCADEAALCDACDRRVHHANKLARKHRRFSLSSAEQSQPLCDICKVNNYLHFQYSAFIASEDQFKWRQSRLLQERRGFVFCQEDRAILCRDCDDPIHSANQLTMKHSRFLLTGARLSAAPSSEKSINVEKSSVISSNNNESSSSSISEYLTKTIPGYRVEDLLVDDTYELHKVYMQIWSRTNTISFTFAF